MGRWSENCLFLSTFRVKNVHSDIGRWWKRSKLCLRSYWVPLMTFKYTMLYFENIWSSDSFNTFLMNKFFIKQPENDSGKWVWDWNFDRTRSCQYATLCTNDKLHVYFSGFYKKKVSASVCYYLSWHSSLIAKCNYGLVWTIPGYFQFPVFEVLL